MKFPNYLINTPTLTALKHYIKSAGIVEIPGTSTFVSIFKKIICNTRPGKVS